MPGVKILLIKCAEVAGHDARDFVDLFGREAVGLGQDHGRTYNVKRKDAKAQRTKAKDILIASMFVGVGRLACRRRE